MAHPRRAVSSLLGFLLIADVVWVPGSSAWEQCRVARLWTTTAIASCNESFEQSKGEVMSQAPPGWYPDPNNSGSPMYWDGVEWRPDLADEARTIATLSRRYISFGPAIAMAFTRFKDFGGRSSRSEYWWWRLFYALVVNVPLRIGRNADAVATRSCIDSRKSYLTCMVVGHQSPIYMAGLVLTLVFFVPDLAIIVRRLHDIGKNGWWVLVFSGIPLAFLLTPVNTSTAVLVLLVTLVVLVWQLIWLVRVGDDTANQWGMVPQHNRRR